MAPYFWCDNFGKTNILTCISFQECEFLCLLSSYLNKDAYFAFNFVREIVVKDVTNQKLWNLFNAVITSSDDTRHNKFLLRLSTRHPGNTYHFFTLFIDYTFEKIHLLS